MKRQIKTERGEVMRTLPVRACIIRNIEHPEWGTWGVMEDKGLHYEIYNRGTRVLSKDEAVKFWEVVR
jgi:hypothetical protein